jgi:hypothetical protein
MTLSQRLLTKTQFPSGYTVTVLECTKSAIVYGFQVNNTSPDILACRGRREPPGCYVIEFAFHDFYANLGQKKVDQKKVVIDLPEALKSLNGHLQEATPTPIAIGTESAKANPQQTIPIAIGTEEIKTTTFDYPLILLVCIGMLVLLGIALLMKRFGKLLTPVPVQNQNHGITKEATPEVSALGKFLFDAKDQRLLLGSEVISLTDKEHKILELLNKNFGELIPRETLMQKIWINEGVITGRSLDMFVSKLRKKLSSDPELRITNVHGKGYKLEIPGMQI